MPIAHADASGMPGMRITACAVGIAARKFTNSNAPKFIDRNGDSCSGLPLAVALPQGRHCRDIVYFYMVPQALVVDSGCIYPVAQSSRETVQLLSALLVQMTVVG